MLITPFAPEHHVWQMTEICKRSGLHLVTSEGPGLVAFQPNPPMGGLGHERPLRMVGFCLWNVAWKRSLRLRQIVVEPTDRCRGIGRELIEALQQQVQPGQLLEVVAMPRHQELRGFMARMIVRTGSEWKASPGDGGMTGFLWFQRRELRVES